MASIVQQNVFFRARDSFDIEWEIRGLSDPAPSIDIMRSESPEGPWKKIASHVPESLHFFRDYSLGFGSITRRLYYQLIVNDGVLEITGDPFFISNPPTGQVRRALSMFNKILRRRTADPCAFFVIRRLGENCSYCGSHGRPSDGRCEHCYGTGRLGGYYTPVKTMVAKTNQNVSQQVASQGDITNNNIQTYWTTSTPYLNAGDMMQDANGTMWKITGEVRRTERQGCVMRQLFSAASQSRTNIVYDLLTDLDANFSAKRYYHLWEDSSGDMISPGTESS